MRRTMMLMTLAGLMSFGCVAQSAGGEKPPADTTPKKFYHLNFNVQELEGDHVINGRSYSVIMRLDRERGASIRAGEKVPYTSSAGPTTVWQQIDVGVNIDCRRLEMVDGGISLDVVAEVSSVIEGVKGTNSAVPPVIRNNKWDSTVTLPLKQPTVLFSSDDPASKRRMQLLATVTLVR